MYILPIEFSRKKGDKDKRKRKNKRSLKQKAIIGAGVLAGAGVGLGMYGDLIKSEYRRSSGNALLKFKDLQNQSKASFATKMRAAQRKGFTYDQGFKILENEQKDFLKKTRQIGNAPKRELATNLGVFGGGFGLAGGIFAGANTKEGKKNDARRRRERLIKSALR
jgi:hypothetical protein